MRVTLAFVSPRRGRAKSEAVETLVQAYVGRACRYLPVESLGYETETSLLSSLGRQPGRPEAQFLLLDSGGELLTSEAFAGVLGRAREDGCQRIVLAVGPADGWSEAARKRSDRTLSLGRMTLPHELARVVAVEQIYRALTILAGHPYHCGH